MIDAHEAAKASGARILFSCGFDSIPFELGVCFCQETAKEKLGAPVPRVKGRVRGIEGGLSGGTRPAARPPWRRSEGPVPDGGDDEPLRPDARLRGPGAAAGHGAGGRPGRRGRSGRS